MYCRKRKILKELDEGRHRLSEFMLEFEQACAELNIPLFVIPPATPKHNGDVERENGTFRDEFYADPNLLADSVNAMRFSLREAVKKYNNYSPNHSLNGLTPMEYISPHSKAYFVSK